MIEENQLRNIKTEKEIRELLKGLILKFDYRSDSVLHYKTVAPIHIKQTGVEEGFADIFNIEIDFFDSEDGLEDLFCYDDLNNFLAKYKIFQIRVHDLGEPTGETIYRSKYTSKDNELYENK